MDRREIAGGLVLALLVAATSPLFAQGVEATTPGRESRPAVVAKFLGGAALALGAHEGGHLALDGVFDARPRMTRVDFHGIPFFAITHRGDLPRRQEFAISSAGFWVQHAGSEWILSRRPHIRRERAPFAKGVLAFNILASGAYAGAALARTGPDERDTRGMAVGSHTDERAIGVLVLVPAVLDAWRYYEPNAAWLKWTSRAIKAGTMLLVLR